MMDMPRAGDGNHALGQQPGEADLRDRGAQPLCDPPHYGTAHAVGGNGIGLETRMLVTAIIRLDRTGPGKKAAAERSEEHTSELQALMRNSYAVFCLKKKN